MENKENKKRVLRNKYSQDIKKVQKDYPEDAFFIERNKDQIIATHLLSSNLADVIDDWAQDSELNQLDLLSLNAILVECLKGAHKIAGKFHGPLFSTFLHAQAIKSLSKTEDSE